MCVRSMQVVVFPEISIQYELSAFQRAQNIISVKDFTAGRHTILSIEYQTKKAISVHDNLAIYVYILGIEKRRSNYN